MKNLQIIIMVTATLLVVVFFFGLGSAGPMIKHVFCLAPGETKTSATVNAGIIIAVSTSVCLSLEALRDTKTNNRRDASSDF